MTETELGLQSLLMSLLRSQPYGFIYGFMPFGPFDPSKEISIAKGMIGRTLYTPPLVVPINSVSPLSFLLSKHEQPVQPLTWYHVFVIWNDNGNYDYRATKYAIHPGFEKGFYSRRIASYLTDIEGKVRPVIMTGESIWNKDQAWAPYTNAKPDESFDITELGDRVLDLEVMR